MNKTTLTATKTPVAEAICSHGEPLAQLSPLSPNLPDYNALDDFAPIEEKQATQGELAEPKKSEERFEMSEENALFFAAMAVSKLELFTKIYLDAPVELDDEQREDVAKKGAVVVRKWMPNGKLPPWLEQWKEEIELGIALGTAGFTIYTQKQKYDQEQKKTQEKTISPSNNTLTPDYSHNIGGNHGNTSE